MLPTTTRNRIRKHFHCGLVLLSLANNARLMMLNNDSMFDHYNLASEAQRHEEPGVIFNSQ